MILGGGSIVPRIFGSSFREFTDLVWPVGAGQLIAALSVGVSLLLKAQRRGSAVLITTAIGSITALALVATLGASYGLLGSRLGLDRGSCCWIGHHDSACSSNQS